MCRGSWPFEEAAPDDAVELRQDASRSGALPVVLSDNRSRFVGGGGHGRPAGILTLKHATGSQNETEQHGPPSPNQWGLGRLCRSLEDGIQCDPGRDNRARYCAGRPHFLPGMGKHETLPVALRVKKTAGGMCREIQCVWRITLAAGGRDRRRHIFHELHATEDIYIYNRLFRSYEHVSRP